MYDYVEEHPETDEGELVFCFGEPGHFCADYIASLDDNERLRLLSRNNFIKKAITIGVAAILVIASIGVFTIIYDVLNSDNYYYFVAMIGD